MKETNNDYTIVKGIADDNELESYRLCFEKNGSRKDLQSLQWLHQKNLVNAHTIYYAMHLGNVAAIYTAMPVIFNVNGLKKKVLQSIDTMTDHEHRGKGLFPKLAARLYDDASEGAFELVYGFPNENSAPGFFKKLNWISFGEGPFLLKPMRLKYFINKLLKRSSNTAPVSEEHVYHLQGDRKFRNNIHITGIETFSEDYDVIWQSFTTKIAVCVDRSASYMNWRYVEKPLSQYSKCGIFVDGKLKGVIVFTIKNKHDGRIGYIMELIYDDSVEQAGDLLLRYAAEIFKKEKVDAVLAWCLPHSFNYKSFTRSLYFPLPVKFRPQHLFFGVRSLKEPNKKLVENLNNWYISYSDSDTV